MEGGEKMKPHELARILRRDLGTARGAVAYADRIARMHGAYATDYANAAEYLRTMYPTVFLLACPDHGGEEVSTRDATCPLCFHPSSK